MSRFHAPAATRGRRLSTGTIAVLSASALLVGTATSASAATETLKESFRGVSVSGFSTSVDADGCTVTDTYVDGDKTLVFLQRFTYDTCEEDGGSATGAFGSASPTTFDVADDGSTVHVVADIELFTDGDVGEPVGRVTVDNTWTVSGPAARIKSVYSETLPGDYRVTFRMRGTRAPATVRGSVPLEDGYISNSAYSVTTQFRV